MLQNFWQKQKKGRSEDIAFEDAQQNPFDNPCDIQVFVHSK